MDGTNGRTSKRENKLNPGLFSVFVCEPNVLCFAVSVHNPFKGGAHFLLVSADTTFSFAEAQLLNCRSGCCGLALF